MKKYLYLAYIASLLSAGTSVAQITITEQRSIGGAQSEAVFPPGITPLPGGNYLLSTLSSSGISGTKTSPAFGNGDGWIMETDAVGNIIWQQTVGGTNLDFRGSVLEFPDAYYFGFSSNSDADGNKTVPSYGSFDYWLIKTDLSGNILWQKVYGTEQEDMLTSMCRTPDGKIILSGYTNAGISVDKTEPSRGGNDFWILAIDSAGNKLWDKSIGGSGNDQCLQSKVLPAGLLFCGNSNSDISGDKSSPLTGALDAWAVFTDFDGNVVKDVSIGGTESDYLHNVQIYNNHIYLMGNTYSAQIWNNTYTNRGGEDGWLVEMTLTGTVTRARLLGSTGIEKLVSLQPLGNGGFALTLYSDGNTDGDKTVLPYGNVDLWLVYIDANWNITNQYVLGGAYIDFPVTTFKNSNGSLCIMAISNTGIDGDKTSPNFGMEDIWMIQLEHFMGKEEASTTHWPGVYPNPATDICTLVLPENAQYERLRIVNSAGQTVYETRLNLPEGGTYTLHTASWAAGAYFIDLQNKQGLSLRSTLLKK